MEIKFRQQPTVSHFKVCLVLFEVFLTRVEGLFFMHVLYSEAQYKTLFWVFFSHISDIIGDIIGVNLVPGANFLNYDKPCLTGNIPLIFTEIARWLAALWGYGNPATIDCPNEGQREDPMQEKLVLLVLKYCSFYNDIDTLKSPKRAGHPRTINAQQEPQCGIFMPVQQWTV